MFTMMEKVMDRKTDVNENENSCPECYSHNIVCQEPYTICMKCHANLGTYIDYRPDWRNDPNGDDMSRCNIARNELLPESSLSTCITVGKNATRVAHELKRTMIWNSIPHSERSMKTKIDEIAYVCHMNNIPDAIVEYAQEIYHKLIRELEKRNMTRKRGNNDKGLKGAAVFVSFQDQGKPKTYKEIADVFEIEAKYVANGIVIYNDLIRPDRASNITQYTDYIDEFCDSLNLQVEHRNRVAYVAEKANKLGILETNTPTSMVAGCISYVATEFGLPIRSTDIAERCSVSVPTINKVCDKLFKRSIDLLDI